MRKPLFGEASLGALVGAVVGAVGGLVAIGIAPAIMTKDPAMLLRRPFLVLMSWVLSTPTGWVIGGQLGPLLGGLLRSSVAEVVGGVVGGLIPVGLLALFGWWLVRG